MSEGLLRTAASTHAMILRPGGPGGQREQIPVNIKSILAGKGTDITLNPDDILMVPNSVAKTAITRTVEAAIQMGTGVVIWGRF